MPEPSDTLPTRPRPLVLHLVGATKGALTCVFLFLQKGQRTAAKLRELLQTHGPFDVVHGHVHFFSGSRIAVVRNGRGAPADRSVARRHHSDRPSARRGQVLLPIGHA